MAESEEFMSEGWKVLLAKREAEKVERSESFLMSKPWQKSAVEQFDAVLEGLDNRRDRGPYDGGPSKFVDVPESREFCSVCFMLIPKTGVCCE